MRPILHDLPSRVEMPLMFDCFSEGFEVHVRRAGGNDDGIETEFGNFLMNELLTGFAAHVFVIHGAVNAGHFSDFFGNFFAVHGSGDIFAAPTSKNADFHKRIHRKAIGVLYPKERRAAIVRLRFK